MRIALAGPPCSGKSETGRILAGILELAFIDTDRLIEERAGTAIPRIFAVHGEERFRRLEKSALQEALAADGVVIALGGGALLDRETRDLVESSCTVCTLLAPDEVLVERNSGGRPLAGDPDAFRALLKERRAHYRSLPNPTDTDGIPPGKVAENLAAWLRKEAPSQ